MPDSAHRFMEVAREAALRAGDLILANLGRLEDSEIGTKQASDFVTRVDRQSEDLIVGLIREAFGDSHHFLAEESMRDAEGGYRWIIDPLDGTTNFIHSYPAFAVSIALEHDGEIILGVVHDPLRKETFTALKGQGARLNEDPINVSGVSDMSGCLMATGFPFKQKHMLPKYLELFSAIFTEVSGIRRAGAAALDFAHLAAGRCDGFFELGLAPWDMAAGSLLITEAGGMITDFAGGGDYLKTGNVLAGTHFTHPFILNKARGVFGGIIDK